MGVAPSTNVLSRVTPRTWPSSTPRHWNWLVAGSSCQYRIVPSALPLNSVATPVRASVAHASARTLSVCANGSASFAWNVKGGADGFSRFQPRTLPTASTGFMANEPSKPAKRNGPTSTSATTPSRCMGGLSLPLPLLLLPLLPLALALAASSSACSVVSSCQDAQSQSLMVPSAPAVKSCCRASHMATSLTGPRWPRVSPIFLNTCG
jgi:hypothetical protein